VSFHTKLFKGHLRRALSSIACDSPPRCALNFTERAKRRKASSMSPQINLTL
jgi:hypothetical protein